MKAYDDSLKNHREKARSKRDRNISDNPEVGEIKDLYTVISYLHTSCKVHACGANETDCAINVCSVNRGRVVYGASFEDQAVSASKDSEDLLPLLERAISFSEPNIVPREDWGADPPKRPYDNLGDPNEITLHHTDGGGRVKSIQKDHQDREFRDIGYHYVIDNKGKIYEGTPVDKKGSHVKKKNTGKIGVAVIGNYNKAELNNEQKEALENLVGWLCQEHNIDPENIKGHRDHGNNECPGTNIYDYLPDLRRGIEERLNREMECRADWGVCKVDVGWPCFIIKIPFPPNKGGGGGSS